ncbi:unnamed protein product, partial [Brenthis ino]
MPKKSKVNKLARMSDEERARYLQHRADIEEEARRRKRELIARFIKGMMTSFNFLVERKNRLLDSLMRAIEDSDDQHRRAFQAHTETLSYFLNIGSQRLDKLQMGYEFQKNNFLEYWDKEELDITDGQDRSDFKLTLIKYIQERDFQTFKKKRDIQKATEKNDARLEVSKTTGGK